MDFALVIKKRRSFLKITQEDLAEVSEVSLCTIKDIERGKANPTLAVVEKVCDVLGLEMKFEVKKTID